MEIAAVFIDGGGPEFAPDRLLGVRVRKFCLWHRLLLLTINSPFMSQGRVSLRDLRTAVGICRLRFGDSRVRRPWLVPAWIYLKAVVFGFSKSPVPPVQRALGPHVEAFLAYTKDYLQSPEYTVIQPPVAGASKPRPRQHSAPDELEHVGELIFWSGWPEWRVWELPIGRANYYRVMARKAAGHEIDFTTPEEKAFRDALPEEFKFKYEG